MAGVEDATEVIPGLTTWVNPGNKFRVVKLHYTADPAKQTPTWKALAKEGMPERGWMREHEISFETPEGLPVIPQFSAANVRVLPILPTARILRGWDFGQASPAVVFGQLDSSGRKRIVGELILEQVTLAMLVDAVKARTVELFGRAGPTFDTGDPEADSWKDLGQIRHELLKQGILLQPAKRATKDSYEALCHEMLRQVLVPGEGVTPALCIHPRCVTLIEALTGAFHYADRPTQREPKPVALHPYKDVVDALRYLIHDLTAATTNFVADMKKAAAADLRW